MFQRGLQLTFKEVEKEVVEEVEEEVEIDALGLV